MVHSEAIPGSSGMSCAERGRSVGPSSLAESAALGWRKDTKCVESGGGSLELGLGVHMCPGISVPEHSGLSYVPIGAQRCLWLR